MERSPEKIQVSSAENGFIPPQQVENKSLESWCRKGPDGRCDTVELRVIKMGMRGQIICECQIIHG